MGQPNNVAMRTENSPLGPVELPADAYYGAQTAQARHNFTISGKTVSEYPEFIKAFAYVKKAAALTNAKLEFIEADRAEVIAKVCDEIIAGKLDHAFELDMFQGGAGTSTNMMFNEVIANRGLEIMGYGRAAYQHLHPNDDVNRSQSTNDAYPTSISIAVCFAMQPMLEEAVRLAAAFDERAEAFNDIVKLGRTQLQDAVPMTLGQEFKAYVHAIEAEIEHVKNAATDCHTINMGGTAIGTGINATKGYQEGVAAELAKLTGLPLRGAKNYIESTWNTNGYVSVSSALKHMAITLSKISNDLRLLSSGPRGGFGEILLPAVQPGSSIMPGKVNPVVPEVVNQVAFYVIGADVTCSMASEAGQMQLNAMEPVMAYSILQSIKLLQNAMATLRENCVVGIRADENRIAEHLNNSTAAATALTPIIGYDKSSKLAKEVIATGKSFPDVVAGHAELPADLMECCDMRGLTRVPEHQPKATERKETK